MTISMHQFLDDLQSAKHKIVYEFVEIYPKKAIKLKLIWIVLLSSQQFSCVKHRTIYFLPLKLK